MPQRRKVFNEEVSPRNTRNREVHRFPVFLSLTDKKKCSNLFTADVYCSKQFPDLSRRTPMKVQPYKQSTPCLKTWQSYAASNPMTCSCQDDRRPMKKRLRKPML